MEGSWGWRCRALGSDGFQEERIPGVGSAVPQDRVTPRRSEFLGLDLLYLSIGGALGVEEF